MKKKSSITGSSKFIFGGNIVTKKIYDFFLIVCVESANWIVLKNEHQKNILMKMVDGASIGEIYSSFKSEEDLNDLKTVLAAITARKFAATDAAPQIFDLFSYEKMNVYLTNACNLRCSHCFMHAGKQLENELSLEEWEQVLQDFKKLGGKNVTFSGGEPLLNKNFDEIIGFTHEIGLTVTVLTNGTLWTKERVERLSKFIDEVQISIDGVDESSNAIIRGKGFFEKITNTVIEFSKQNVRTSVATTFTFENLYDDTPEKYKEMIMRINEACSNKIFFKLSKKILRGRNVNYSDEENLHFYNKIIEIENGIDINAKFKNFIEGHIPNVRERNCGFGGVSINSNGDVYYCNRINEVECYGNIRSKRLDHFFAIGKNLNEKTSVDNLEPCKTCYLRYICCGGCRIDDCNFHGLVKKENKSFTQTKCTELTRNKFEKKLIDCFNFFYHI